MDWYNWKIYLVLAILVAVVILILWYRCPTEDYHSLPGRPDSQKFLAPAPVLNPVNPSTFCDIPLTITTKWGCNFETTIYNVDNVHFRLSYIDSNSNEIPINDNITDDTDGLSIDNAGADFHYSYEYSLSGISPDYYTLKIESFVPNVPEATVRHCSTCTQDLTLLPSQYNSVSVVNLNQEVWYNVPHGQVHIDPTWPTPPLSPLLNENDTFYHLSIEDADHVPVPGTTVNDIVFDTTRETNMYKYSPTIVPVGVGYQVVIYVGNNSNDICTGNSSETRSATFSIVEASMPIPQVTSGGDNKYCILDASFPVKWNFACGNYTGAGDCPTSFSYSVHVSDEDQSFDLFFDNILNSSAGTGDIYESNDGSHSGILNVKATNNYTFAITPMLPAGTYTMIISIFVMSSLNGEPVVDQESDNSEQDPMPLAVVQDTTQPQLSSSNIEAGADKYAVGNTVTCEWDSPTNTNHTYSYVVSLIDSDGDLVPGSPCSTFSTAYEYEVYDIGVTSTCSDNPTKITLIEGERYNINVVTTSTIVNPEWCEGEAGDQFTDGPGGVTGTFYFDIVNCVTSNDCKLPSFDTNLLATDPTRRGIYNLWCIYADDPNQCLIDVGKSLGLPTDNLAINTKDIPNSQCDTSTNTCVRKNCPILSRHPSGEMGCVAPGQDVQSSWMKNSIPSTQSGNFISYKSYENYDSDTPFIPFISNSRAASEYSSDLDRVVIPGIFQEGGSIFLYPFYMKFFHPFLLWTFTAKGNSTVPYSQKAANYSNDCTSGQGNLPTFYMPKHTGSGTYAQTLGCHNRNKDGGTSCWLRFGNVEPSENYVQGTGSTQNNLTTFSTWKFVPPYQDGNTYANVNKDAPYGDCGGKKASAQFNTPSDNSQNAWYFGIGGYGIDLNDATGTKDGHAGELKWEGVYDDFGEGMRKMVLVRSAISNNTYWKGLSTQFWASNTQDPNNGPAPGPPYKNNRRDDAITKNSFCAPVQYGVLTVSQKSYDAPTQSNFYLEAYTWDNTYTHYDGLGFFGLSNVMSSNISMPLMTVWPGGGVKYETGTKNQQLYFALENDQTSYLSGTNAVKASNNTYRLDVSFSDSDNAARCVIDPTGGIRFQYQGAWLYLAISEDGTVMWIEPGYPKDSTTGNYTIPMWAMTWKTAYQATTSVDPT